MSGQIILTLVFLHHLEGGGGEGYSLIWTGYGLHVYRYVRPKGYGFSGVLVINRVLILADFDSREYVCVRRL